MSRPNLRVPWPGGQAARLVAGGLIACLAGLLAVLLVAGALAWRGARVQALPPAPMPVARREAIQHGAYLAKVANCVACHTEPGQPLMSGGRPIDTPFGRLAPGNLTPDPGTGIGAWSEDDFRRALHQGISADGRLLYPAFPYPHFSAMRVEDVQDLWLWLRSLPPAPRSHPAPALRWPANQPWALAIWRGLHFAPAPPAPPEMDRGAYLASAVAHCGACHDRRDSLSGPARGGSLQGQRMPDSFWWAPSLRRVDQAGVQDWAPAEIEQWLRTGRAPECRALGPMAEVIGQGTRHLDDADTRALAVWLRALPREPVPAPDRFEPGAQPADGPALYRQHCADCHGEQGQGDGERYPALAGSRLVQMAQPDNLILAIMEGGFGAEGGPLARPWGMPPYGALLGDADLAAITNHLRSHWGHQASPVEPARISRLRGRPE